MGRGARQEQATAVRRRPAKRTVKQVKRQLSKKAAQQKVKPAPACAGSIKRTTSKGVEARLDFYRDVEHGGNKGWVMDMVEIHTADSPAGYLKISYISPENLHEHYPTACEWAARYKGKYGNLGRLLSKKKDTWRRADYLSALTSADEWAQWNVERARKEQRQASSTPELADLWRVRKAEITAEHENQYQDFCANHVDRPLVDFIRIYNEWDRDPYIGGQRSEGRGVSSSLQHQGLGTLLYQTGALWMHQRGLRLYAGGQSPDAQGVWRDLDNQGLVKRARLKRWNKSRRYIDAPALLKKQPELMQDFPQE